MNDRIVYLLSYLKLVQPEVLTEEEFNNISLYIQTSGIDTTHQWYDENAIIETCDDRVLKLCYLRDVKIEREDKYLISNKKRYKFDNIYCQNDDVHISVEMIEFLSKRITCNKDSSVVFYAYSGAGKSTLMCTLLGKLKHSNNFRLYEIYNNKKFVYMNGLKVPHEGEAPIFVTTNIISIINRFSTKHSNGINYVSSRSHTILEVIYDGCVLKILDLAGNEKIDSKDSEIINESKYINSSLYNITRFFNNRKFKQSKCLLLNVLKTCANIVLTVILHDNGASNPVSHLKLLSDILK